MPDVLGPYRIQHKIGEGGMGIVYAARDERLGRTVALKTLSRTVRDETARLRLWREARAAASVNHPNICQVYDVGEQEGELYLAMEMLEGESLAMRLTRGTMPLRESLHIILDVLAALEALHSRNFLHRDLKPSNVFLTPHAVKLLDFGLSRPIANDPSTGKADLTVAGVAIGTPRYMAPEQWSGDPIGAPADLFAVGCLLFEMIAGRPAYPGNSVPEIFYAVFHQEPPALSGGAEVMAIDRIIQRALARRPDERYPSAATMAADIRPAAHGIDSGEMPVARAMKRLVVLPFRMLRPDPDMDFLSIGLANAVTESLSGLDSILVRSSAAAARFAGDEPDLRGLASEVAVDAVLIGTLFRAGDRVRVSAQLVAAPGGEVLASKTAEGKTGDLFALQDDLARQIVETISGPLTPGETKRLGHDVPEDPAAYEFYVRANVLGSSFRKLPEACSLYKRCVECDPRFAPGWARLARAHRVIAKYGLAERDENIKLAEEAFRRAFELNPDLSIGHNLYTYFEVEELGRSREAMVRLLERAAVRPTDPELYAGLVLACRFSGLVGPSLAADRRARRLDPSIRTGVAYTYWMMGDFRSAAEYDEEEGHFMQAFAEAMLGREDLLIKRLREGLEHHPSPHERHYLALHVSAVEGRKEETIAHAEGFLGSSMRDPEARAGVAMALARAGALNEALDMLSRALEGGYAVHLVTANTPWCEPLRKESAWDALRLRSEAFTSKAAAMFRSAGGERLLGVAAA